MRRGCPVDTSVAQPQKRCLSRQARLRIIDPRYIIYCSLSGVQNRCEQMKAAGEADRDIARYCVEAVCAALRGMTRALTERYPGLPLLYSGGVMSNSLIRERFTEEFGAVFAAPGYSSDNAVGVAVLGATRTP